MSELDRLAFWQRCCLILALTALAAIVALNDATDRAEQFERAAEGHARVIVGCLNGNVLETPEVRVTCRVKQRKVKS